LPNPSFVLREAQSYQNDGFIRTMIGAQFTPGKMHFNLQSSYVHHALEYRENLSTPISPSTFDSFINNFDVTVFSSPFVELTGGLNHLLEMGTAAELYPSDIQRNRLAAYGALKYNSRAFNGTLSARQEAVNGTAMPFAFSLGAEVPVNRSLKFTGSTSRSYRIPTMNDLYWRGAGAEGNSDLHSEHSWSEEIAAHYNKKFKKVTLGLTGTAFSNQVDNWILWQPMGAVWSPENIKKVWSRGSEAKASLTMTSGTWTHSLSSLYSFTRSTTVEVYDPIAKNEVGNQLIYTPIHEGSITIGSSWKKWKASLVANFTGKQYTDSDNNPVLAMDAYQNINIWMQRDISIGTSLHNTIIFEINNITDAVYETRVGYPMPGRNYRISLNFSIQKPKSI
jgi:vitamin B12 transporter